jgi:hypothetical protein
VKKRINILLLLSTLFLFRCAETVKPTPYDYTKVFTGESAKGWELTAIQIKQQGTGDINLDRTALRDGVGIAECALDDHYIFYADSEHTFQIQEGASKCDAADPDVYYSGSWSFVNSNASLSFVFPLLSSGRLPYIVREITSDQLVVEIFLDENNTASYRVYFKSVPVE